jgi:hypothetical protein
MEVPMMDEDEYKTAIKLYADGIRDKETYPDFQTRFKAVLDFYNKKAGWEATHPNTILHHRIALYGPPCEKCGKPYRTNQANFCAACGNKRT